MNDGEVQAAGENQSSTLLTDANEQLKEAETINDGLQKGANWLESQNTELQARVAALGRELDTEVSRGIALEQRNTELQARVTELEAARAHDPKRPNPGSG